MLIPQGMAYAMLAELPPIYGLYAATIPMLMYALLGTSRQLSVGPVALVSLLVAGGVSGLTDNPAEYIFLTTLLAFMVGIIQWLMGVFRLGFLVNYLSSPVIAGFTSAAALMIGVSQLKNILGLAIPRGKIHETLWHVFQNSTHIHWATVAIGLGAMLILFVAKKYKRIPGALVVVVLGILMANLLKLEETGLAVLGEIPSGLPAFILPEFSIINIKKLLPVAFAIAFVGFTQSIAVAKTMEAKRKDHIVDANQEMIAIGTANMVGAFFQSFPIAGGLSRSAVNEQVGAKTTIASIISVGVIVGTLLFLTPLFYHLPNAVLAAIILVAIIGLVDIDKAFYLWKIHKGDFGLFMLTAIGTLILGVQQGIIFGVLLSLAIILYRASNPHIAPLGKIPNSPHFRNINRFDNLEDDSRFIILRIDAPLFFANLAFVKKGIEKHWKAKPDAEAIVISSQPISSVDSSAVEMIQDLVTLYKSRGTEIYFAGLIGPVRDTLIKAEIFEDLGKNHFFMNLNEALEFLEKGTIHEETRSYVFQGDN